MVTNILEFIFIGALTLSNIILLAAVIFALLGYFGKDTAQQPKRYAMAAKLLLIYALIFVVGFGGCLIMVSSGF